MGQCQSQCLKACDDKNKKKRPLTNRCISLEPLLHHGVMVKPIPAFVDNAGVKEYMCKLEKDKVITAQKRQELNVCTYL